MSPSTPFYPSRRPPLRVPFGPPVDPFGSPSRRGEGRVFVVSGFGSVVSDSFTPFLKTAGVAFHLTSWPPPAACAQVGVLGRALFVRTACCFGALSKVFLSVFLFPGQTWCNATRDGLPTPSGWYEVVRGPRPQSVQWPRRQHSNQWSGQWPAVSESWRTPIRRRWHRNNVLRLNPGAHSSRLLCRIGGAEFAEARG